MIAAFTFATQANAVPPADRCEQLCLTGSGAEDTAALTALARLFTAGKPAAEVCRRLADVGRVVREYEMLREAHDTVLPAFREKIDQCRDLQARIECLEAQVSAQAEELAANIGKGGGV